MSLQSAIALFALSAGLAACSAPSSNAIEGEANPIVAGIAAQSKAWTFAQERREDGRVATLLVKAVHGDAVDAVDLTSFGAPLDADVFDVVAKLGDAGLRRAFSAPSGPVAYRMELLRAAGGVAKRHLATGTNFREHSREAEIPTVFNFPKFGSATPARTTVATDTGQLLDYEVEICARFDRDIRSVADFDAARKGFFLCGDFTDRARLLRTVDPANVASGRGFSDAKSAPDFFPTGALLVVPKDWRAFVAAERMVTEVNRQKRQDARGAGMIRDFRAVVGKALTNGGGGHYTYRGASIPLLADNAKSRGSAVMSGTSAGVLFMPPRLGDYVLGIGRYILTGPMVRRESPQRNMIEAFIRKEQRSGRYLQPGDLVVHRSSSMGDVAVLVRQAPKQRPRVAAGAPRRTPVPPV